jgi:hypothetical protein
MGRSSAGLGVVVIQRVDSTPEHHSTKWLTFTARRLIFLVIEWRMSI